MEKDVGFHILDIPIHIISEIMFNLSALSIIRCCSVCTKFRTILSDSSFQQTYYSRAPISFVLLSDHHRLTCIDSSSNQIQSYPNSNHGSSCIAMQLQPSSSTTTTSKRRTSTSTSTSTRTRTRTRAIHTKQQSVINNRNNNSSRFVTFHIHRRMNLINSSNGLLCLRASNYHSHSLYYISNPLLGELLTIPPAPSPADHNLRFSAFGFDPKKKIFKILQLVSKSNRMVAELYQSDSHGNTWTVILNAPSATSKFNSSSFDPCLNGALHWITDHDQISELICSFDLNTNKFKSVAPPPHFNAEYVSKISGVSIGVLKGCLCLCYVVDGAQFETWVMDKYGVKESWRKAFSIDINSYCGLSPQDKHRPIGFNSCGDMWLRADSDSQSYSQCLVSFSPETGVFRHIDIGGIASRNIQATPQVLSYVSMKEMVNLGNNTHLQLLTIKPDKNNDLGFNLLTMGHFR